MFLINKCSFRHCNMFATTNNITPLTKFSSAAKPTKKGDRHSGLTTRNAISGYSSWQNTVVLLR